MSWREIALVWKKETLDTLRDRRTILAMIVLPLLLYPIMIIGISQLGLRQVEKLRASPARVAVLPPGSADELVASLRADSSFVLVLPDDPAGALESRGLDAVVRVPADFPERLARLDSALVTVQVDLSRDRGAEMRDRVVGFLQDWRAERVRERLGEHALPDAFARPFEITIDNVAGAPKMAGSLVGRILPFFLVVMMMTGAFYPAIDVTAGERERGTLETLLVSPAGRFNLVLGKFLTVFLASIVTTLANLASIAFTVFFLLGNADLGSGLTADITSLVDWRAIGLIFVIMIPMALFFSAMALFVASFARSFKEAQNYLSPLVIACMAPAYLAFLPGIEISYGLALVPVANVVLLSRELLLGNYIWPFFAITMVVMTVLALLLLERAMSLFSGEAMLAAGEGGPKLSWSNLFRPRRRRREETLNPQVVGTVFLLVLLGFFYVGTPLQLANVKLGLTLTQVFVIAGVPLLAMVVLGIPVVQTLRLRPPRRLRTLLLAVLAAPGLTLLAALVGMGQGLFLETPESYRQLMEKLFQAEAGGNLALAILVFAVVPGICEEILFRGFVLRGLLSRTSPAKAILWSAVLFGAFHFDLYRLLPTATLGLALGWVAWRTGSLWPVMVLHAVHNATAVVATNVDHLPGLEWLQEGRHVPLGVILGVAVVSGLAAWGLARAGGDQAAAAPAEGAAEPGPR